MFNVTRMVTERNIAADGVFSYDLAVNPLSVVLIGLRPLNDTGTLANFGSYRDICAAINKAEILHKGRAIYSMRGEDIAAWNYFRHGLQPLQATHRNVNNDKRFVPVPLLLGKHAYDTDSCFPASKKGELSLVLDLDVADTGYDTLNLSVDTIEMLGASPKEFERKTTVSYTTPAIGDNDLPMPLGNLVRSILLFGTTLVTGGTPAPSWGNVRALLDNQEIAFAGTDWEVLQCLHSLWGKAPPTYDAHKHIVTTDGNAQAELATLAGVYDIGLGYLQYALMDFDPLQDGDGLDTADHNSFGLRYSAETADAIRAIVCERVAASSISG